VCLASNLGGAGGDDVELRHELGEAHFEDLAQGGTCVWLEWPLGDFAHFLPVAVADARVAQAAYDWNVFLFFFPIWLTMR
jgi:hypothetical protein